MYMTSKYDAIVKYEMIHAEPVCYWLHFTRQDKRKVDCLCNIHIVLYWRVKYTVLEHQYARLSVSDQMSKTECT